MVWNGWLEIDGACVRLRWEDSEGQACCRSLPPRQVPTDLMIQGAMCRVSDGGHIEEWCRETWTQDEIDEMREAGRELDSLFEEA